VQHLVTNIQHIVAAYDQWRGNPDVPKTPSDVSRGASYGFDWRTAFSDIEGWFTKNVESNVFLFAGDFLRLLPPHGHSIYGTDTAVGGGDENAVKALRNDQSTLATLAESVLKPLQSVSRWAQYTNLFNLTPDLIRLLKSEEGRVRLHTSLQDYFNPVYLAGYATPTGWVSKSGNNRIIGHSYFKRFL
jgi:hypothetical protein